MTQMYMVNLGIQEASAALTGNWIGAMNVPQAKRYQKVILCHALGIGILMSVLLLSFGRNIVGLFTADQGLIDMVMKAYPIYCLGNLIDAMNCAYQGCSRALGI